MNEQVDRPRVAAQEDSPVVRDIVHAAYAKYLTRMDRLPAPMVEDIDAHICAGHVWITGHPATALICLILRDDALLVDNVAVHPDSQGKGHGRSLLDFAEHEARRLGLSRLELFTNEVMVENVAIYRHLGYEVVDRRTEDGYRRIFMEKLV